jgi:Spy/CpxP family protein refolding chaperone
MTRTLFVGALMVALSIPATALAQRGAGGAPQRDAVTQPHAGHAVPYLRLREELQLTPQQVTQLEAIATRLQAQNRPLMEQMRAAGVGHQRAAARGQQMTPEQRQQMRERMERMTPEQRQRMHQMTPEQRGQMRERAGQMRERMHQMTPEQRAEMRARHQGERPQGAGHGSRVPAELQPVAAQLRQNHTAAMQAAREVLTPQQRERAQQLMRERAGQRGERGPAAHRGHR